MNEIEKMYENVGIKPEINYVCDKEHCKQHSIDCQKCSHLYDTREDYPDFTAEKQLELVKWLFNTIYLLCLSPLQNSGDFENDLAGLINCLWQDLTEEDKQQIKEILE